MRGKMNQEKKKEVKEERNEKGGNKVRRQKDLQKKEKTEVRNKGRREEERKEERKLRVLLPRLRGLQARRNAKEGVQSRPQPPRRPHDPRRTADTQKRKGIRGVAVSGRGTHAIFTPNNSQSRDNIAPAARGLTGESSTPSAGRLASTRGTTAVPEVHLLAIKVTAFYPPPSSLYDNIVSSPYSFLFALK